MWSLNVFPQTRAQINLTQARMTKREPLVHSCLRVLFLFFAFLHSLPTNQVDVGGQKHHPALSLSPNQTNLCLLPLTPPHFSFIYSLFKFNKCVMWCFSWPSWAHTVIKVPRSRYLPALLSQSVIQQLALYHFILIKWPFHPGLPLWPLQLSLLMWMKLEEHVDLAPASLACLHLRIFHIADEGHEWCKRNLRSAHVFTVSYGKLVLCTWFPNANVIAWWLGSE